MSGGDIAPLVDPLLVELEIRAYRSNDGELRGPALQAVSRIRYDAATITALQAEVAALREALTPSGATKAAYIGEFTFNYRVFSPCGEYEINHTVAVPWTTTKEIMAAIAARAALERPAP